MEQYIGLDKKEKQRINMKRYQLKHKDKIAAKRKIWYWENIDKVRNNYLKNRDKYRAYYLKNKDKRKEYNKKYHLLNKEKGSQSCKKWYLENKEKLRLYRIMKRQVARDGGEGSIDIGFSYTKEYRNLYKRKRRGGDSLTIKTTQMVYEDNIKHFGTLTCIYCLNQIVFGKDSLEHKQPISRGGTNEYSNLAIACRKCNSSKGNKTEEEYRKVILNHG